MPICIIMMQLCSRKKIDDIHGFFNDITCHPGHNGLKEAGADPEIKEGGLNLG